MADEPTPPAKAPWFAASAVSGTRPPMDPLALVFVVGFFAITAAYFFVEPPKDNAAALNLIVGAIIGIIGTIATFRWGSSDSAKVKSETIAAAIAPQEPKP